MKYLLVGMIKIYQLIPGPWHDMCRFNPTCSNYAIEAYEIHGFFKGTYLTIKRLLKCGPWSDFSYDPVPPKKEKNL